MAGIETLTGVAKINAFEYEVTAEVSVGSGIDDLEYATFVQKSTGLLKFDSGCTTTFTNCKFVEETSAASAPRDKRFIANSSTAPVFKGCKFIIDHGASGNGRGASDFDVPSGTSPTFDFSEDGSPCYFIRNNGSMSSGVESKANHYYSGTFNSYIVDQNGGGGAFEVMASSLAINDLTLKDRGYSNPLGSRHLIIYTSRSSFHNKTTTFRKLKADNVSLFGGANQTNNSVIIKVVDAKGQLLRSEDTANSQRGYLQFLRTYKSAPIDATTLNATSVKCFLKNTDNGDIIINGLTSGVDEELLQYKYEHNTTSTKGVITYDANGDPQTTGSFFTVANSYIRGFISYDRLPTSRTFKIEDRDDGTPLVHDIILSDDTTITEADKAIVDAYSEIDNSAKFYDRAKSYLTDNYAGEGATIVARSGNEIDLGSYNLVIDATATSAFAISGTTITIKATTFTGDLTTTGTITLSSGAIVVGTYTDSSGTIATLTYTITDLVPNSRVQLFNNDTNQEFINTVVTTIDYTGTYVEGAEISAGDEIRIRVTYQDGTTAYLPYVNTASATTSGFSFKVNQDADAVYNSNVIDGSSVTTLSADFPNVQVDVNDPDGIADVREIYAKYVAIIYTADGIRNWAGGITAVDNVNYRVNTSIANLTIQNVSTVAVNLAGARIYRDDGQIILAAEDGDKPITQDNGEFVQFIKPQVEASLSTITKNTDLIPALL